MASTLIRTITDKVVLPGDVLYIDPSNTQIQGDVIYSVQLEINDDDLGKLEYNSIYEETLASDNTGPEFFPGDGTNAALNGEPLPEIAVSLYQRPPRTGITKPKKVKVGTTQVWSLPADYDLNNEYKYEWEVVETPPAPIPAFITDGQGTKNISLKITRRGLLYLRCNIYRLLSNGLYGCPQIPRVVQEVGFTPETVIISRNRYT